MPLYDFDVGVLRGEIGGDGVLDLCVKRLWDVDARPRARVWPAWVAGRCVHGGSRER